MNWRCCCCSRNYNNMDITFEGLNKILNNNVVNIFDVRSKQEFDEGHLDGAINLPLADIKKVGLFVSDKYQNIVVYCSSGVRSKKAQRILNAMGYMRVYNLVEGI